MSTLFCSLISLHRPSSPATVNMSPIPSSRHKIAHHLMIMYNKYLVQTLVTKNTSCSDTCAWLFLKFHKVSPLAPGREVWKTFGGRRYQKLERAEMTADAGSGGPKIEQYPPTTPSERARADSKRIELHWELVRTLLAALTIIVFVIFWF